MGELPVRPREFVEEPVTGIANTVESYKPDRVPARSWYTLGLLTVIFLLAALDRAVVSVVVEPLRNEFDVDDAQLGFLAGLAFGIPYALASLPFGMLVDRFNRRNLLSVVLGLWSLLTAMCGFAQNFFQLTLFRMLVGTAEAGFPAAHSMITDLFPPRRRPMALGIFMSGGSVAYIVIFALGGWIVEEWGWRMVFLAAGPPGIIMAILLFLTAREPLRGGTEGNAPESNSSTPAFKKTLRYLWRKRSFRHMFVGYALIAATQASFWSWIGSLLIRVHGLDIATAGLYIAVGAGVAGFFGALFGAIVADRLSKRGPHVVLTFIALSAMILTPLGIAMSLAPTIGLALTFLVIVGFTKSVYAGPSQGIILSIARARMRGVSSSLLNISGTLLGFGIGPVLAGTISYLLGGGDAIRFGLASLFLLNLWAGYHFWAARRTIEADIEAALTADPT